MSTANGSLPAVAGQALATAPTVYVASNGVTVTRYADGRISASSRDAFDVLEATAEYLASHDRPTLESMARTLEAEVMAAHADEHYATVAARKVAA